MDAGGVGDEVPAQYGDLSYRMYSAAHACKGTEIRSLTQRFDSVPPPKLLESAIGVVGEFYIFTIITIVTRPFLILMMESTYLPYERDEIL